MYSYERKGNRIDRDGRCQRAFEPSHVQQLAKLMKNTRFGRTFGECCSAYTLFSYFSAMQCAIAQHYCCIALAQFVLNAAPNHTTLAPHTAKSTSVLGIISNRHEVEVDNLHCFLFASLLLVCISLH